MKSTLLKPEQDAAKLQSAFSSPLLNWYRRNRRDLPWRRTRDPYAILVSEIMLQQTQVKTVLPYYERWMTRYPTLHSLAAASEEQVLKSWEGLGYYRRARLLQSAARLILQEYGGKFPKAPEDIAQLPGIGDYTLGAVASIAFNLPLPILDGNVIRVISRWFGIRQNTRETATRKQLWKLAKILIPEGAAGDFNQSLMELGALICVPRKPLCLLCPIRKECWALAHSAQEQLPVTPPAPATIRQFEYAGLVIRSGRVLLRRRTGGQRMEGLWQFPSIMAAKSSEPWAAPWKKTFGPFRESAKLATIQYSVTHHRIRLEFFQIHEFNRRKADAAQWVPLAKARELAFTAAHRKLANRFLGPS